MLGHPDPKFRKGICLILTGVWITLFGFMLAVFGALMAVIGVIVVIFGGCLLALGYDHVVTVPPLPPAAGP